MSTSSSYERLSSTKIDVKPLLETVLQELLLKIFRRLSLKQSLSNPWGIKFQLKVHRSIFIPFWKAIRDHGSEFGRTITIDRNKRTKSLNWINIKFSHFGALRQHLSKGLGNDAYGAEGFLKKSTNQCSLKVIATDTSPVELHFDCKKNTLFFKSKYQVKNQYGNIISLI